jgi:hypothetical protein
MKTKLKSLIVLVVALSINSAKAQSYHDAGTQQERIRVGYKSGKLTQSEFRQLTNQQKNIRNKTYRSKCTDGQISRSERARIIRNKKMAHRNMYTFNHNNRIRL